MRDQDRRIAALRERIRAMRAAGMSQRKMAICEGLAAGTISHHCRAMGLPPVSRGGGVPNNRKVIALPSRRLWRGTEIAMVRRNLHLTDQEISALLPGRTIFAVGNIRRYYGMPKRGSGACPEKRSAGR